VNGPVQAALFAHLMQNRTVLLKHNVVIFLLTGVLLSACSAGHAGNLSVPSATLTTPPLTATTTLTSTPPLPLNISIRIAGLEVL
jgi:hypothetical protein